MNNDGIPSIIAVMAAAGVIIGVIVGLMMVILAVMFIK